MKKYILLALLACLSLHSIGQSADSLKSLIYYHYDRSEFVEVISYAQQVLTYYKHEKDIYNMAGCYNVMGVAYQRLGQFDEAINSYNHCNELMEQLRLIEPENSFYQKNIRYTQNNIASIYSDMGEYEQSVAMYKSCLEMLGTPKDTADYLDKATYLQNLADIYLVQSQDMDSIQREKTLDEALLMAQQAYDYSERYGDLIFKKLHRMVTLSAVYYHTGMIDAAFETAEEGLALAKKEENLFMQCDFQILIASLYTYQHDYQKAEEKYAEAIALARIGQYDENEHKALDGAYLAAKNFDTEKALHYLEESVQLKDSIFNQDQQKLIREYQARYGLSEKEHQLEIQQERNKWNLRVSIVLLIITILLIVLLVVWVRLNNANRIQKETLKNINIAKDKLISMTSHDVKTSVIAQNMVLDQLYLQCDSMNKEDLKTSILTLKTSSDALKEKLTNILQWVMIELGSQESHPSRFNLSQLVNSCVAFQRAALTAKNITLNQDVNPLFECNDDKNLTNIVLQNLLSNAVKFSNQDGSITIKAEDDTDRIWISVIDNGVGIPPEKLKLLTKDIVDSQQGTAGETGTGIGLLVCRQLLERNKSNLLIESTLGKGSTLRFSINK